MRLYVRPWRSQNEKQNGQAHGLEINESITDRQLIIRQHYLQIEQNHDLVKDLYLLHLILDRPKRPGME